MFTCFLNLCAIAAVISPPFGLKKDAACSTTAPLDASSRTLSAVAWSVRLIRKLDDKFLLVSCLINELFVSVSVEVH